VAVVLPDGGTPAIGVLVAHPGTVSVGNELLAGG
jgi:hypothetical protein